MDLPDGLRDFEWHDLPVEEIAISSRKLVVTVTPYVEEAGGYRSFRLVLDEPTQMSMTIGGTLTAADLKNIELASFSVTDADGDVLSGSITFLPGTAGIWTVEFRRARWSLLESATAGIERQR